MQNIHKMILVGTTSAALAIGISLAYLHKTPSNPRDAFLDRFIAVISKIDTYSQHVETNMHFPDRDLRVAGKYLIDRPNARYSTISTTTITLPDTGVPVAHDFTLSNIAIGKDVYNRIMTMSPVLVHTIPSSKDWRHFTEGSIPAVFKNIAIPGPLLDNLLLFAKSGTLLTVIDHTTRQLGSTTVEHYRFRLSGDPPPHDMGTLRALMARIGRDGMVEAWIDTKTARPLYLHFSNAIYQSTTTITSIDTPLLIEKPWDAR